MNKTEVPLLSPEAAERMKGWPAHITGDDWLAIDAIVDGRAVVVSAADFAMMRSVKRIADTGTAENFLKLSDTDKRRWFAMALEESSRRKAAEQKVEDLSLDANRYRKLRKCVWNQSPLAVVRDPKRAVRLGYDCPSHDRLDEAVDQLPNLGEAE